MRCHLLSIYAGLVTSSLLSSSCLAFVSPMRRATASIAAVKGEASTEEDDVASRTSFSDAADSFIEEEDTKRLEDMGDFDSNPAYETDSIEKMRAAIRARTADLGIEKSKVSADYIKQREDAARSGGAQQDRETTAGAMFGGIDLSKISTDETPGGIRGELDPDLPAMFYDPEKEMTDEEMDEVDPVRTKSLPEQALAEIGASKWPTPLRAVREMLLMALIAAGSAFLIIGADNTLRDIYTKAGFIPSEEVLANYASRFDGLDLPSGWMNNMNEQDMAKLADNVNSKATPAKPTIIYEPSTSGGLPDL